ncbi:MAG: LamB/YcsF family protein [Myxococcota bacterium]
MRTRLGIDLGELPDEPEALYESAQIAWIACGGHAGDAETMRSAVARCRKHGVLVGAHPSYPDRAGFGRTATAMAPDALRETARAQCAALRAIAGEVIACKPHGALYHAAARDPEVARALVGGVAEALGPVPIVGPPGGACAAIAPAYWTEGFADRGYRGDALVPRGEPGALLGVEAAIAQAKALAGRFDVLCVHGDSPDAVAIAREVRRVLREEAPLPRRGRGWPKAG